MANAYNDDLDKGCIRRQGSRAGSGRGEGAAGHGASESPGARDPDLSVFDAHIRALERSRSRKRKQKKAAALLHRRPLATDERLRAKPTGVSLSPWERTVRIRRRSCVPLHSVGGRRGPIVEFTRASQRRLLRELYSIGGLWQHVVLTYPQRFPRRGDEAKKHVQAFCRWLKRLGLGGVWVMEFQQDRGAPHFHLLLNGHLAADDARCQWLKVIGGAGPLTSSCGVQTEAIRDQYRIRSYVAKRHTKEVPVGFAAVGKFYGTFGKLTRIPTIDCVYEEHLPCLIRALRTLDRKRRERRGWKRRRDSGRWSCSFGKWTDSELRAIQRLIVWANGR